MNPEPMRSHASPSGATGAPGVVAVVILGARLDWSRLIEVLVREHLPDAIVRPFTELADAEHWVAGASMSVLVLTDLDAFGGIGAYRATGWSSRAGDVSVVVLADADEEPNWRIASEARIRLAGRAALALTQRPGRLAEWRACIRQALTDPATWHTASRWRTLSGSDA